MNVAVNGSEVLSVRWRLVLSARHMDREIVGCMLDVKWRSASPDGRMSSVQQYHATFGTHVEEEIHDAEVGQEAQLLFKHLIVGLDG